MVLGKDISALYDNEPMNILFEINHPGQVHLLRHTIIKLRENGHKVIVIAKDEQIIRYLLDFYRIPYIVLGTKGKGIRGKLLKQLFFDLKALFLIYQGKYTLGVGSSITNDHASFLSPLHSIHLSDDDPNVVPFVNLFSYPFSKVILSPDCVKFKGFEHKNIAYSGYHELTYLHPNRFQPNPSVLKDAGLKGDEPFFVMRFNVFKAHHDVGIKGLSLEQKLFLIDMLRPHGKIFVTTERDIEPELKEYQMTVSSEKAHSLMAYASLFLGDSQTMTSEAAVLGIPSLRCNSFAGKISYLEEQEKKYGLTYAFLPKDFEKLLDKLKELLIMPNLKQEWQTRRQKMLSDKIDVTAFMVWFIENYPASFKIMKENPDYQYQFK